MVPLHFLKQMGGRSFSALTGVQPFDHIVAGNQIFDAKGSEHIANGFAAHGMFAYGFHLISVRLSSNAQ
jgi:hypothetical protein